MEILYSPRFVKQYKKLSCEVKVLVKEKAKIFKINPFDPRLKTHKLHGDLSNYYSFSVNYKTRVIFCFDSISNIRFELIGNHDIY